MIQQIRASVLPEILVFLYFLKYQSEGKIRKGEAKNHQIALDSRKKVVQNTISVAATKNRCAKTRMPAFRWAMSGALPKFGKNLLRASVQ